MPWHVWVGVEMIEGTEHGTDDEASFDELFRAELPRLAALGTALSGDREVGRDLAQEALTRTYQEWEHVRRLEQPGSWARRVLVNLARDRARHLEVRRRRLPELAGRMATHGHAADERASDGETWAAVAELPERQRTAVALFYVGDRSVSDVADEMGVREGTVKATLHAARRNLRRALTEGAR